jgi:Putative restriction endonuclease
MTLMSLWPVTCFGTQYKGIGRPKGYRGSYQQWLENNIAPQVVFEILSPGNRLAEMTAKFEFYDRHGAEEYYIYDPDRVDFTGWLRQSGRLQGITNISGWVSPRLGVRFELNEELEIYTPAGELFLSPLEISQKAEAAQLEAVRQQARATAAEEQKEIERDRADVAEQKAAAMAAKLKELGIELDL